jgi:hypothetical protein
MISIRKTCVFDPSAFELMQLAPYTFKTREIILSFFSLEHAGELHIIVLIEEEKSHT